MPLTWLSLWMQDDGDAVDTPAGVGDGDGDGDGDAAKVGSAAVAEIQVDTQADAASRLKALVQAAQEKAATSTGPRVLKIQDVASMICLRAKEKEYTASYEVALVVVRGCARVCVCVCVCVRCSRRRELAFMLCVLGLRKGRG